MHIKTVRSPDSQPSRLFLSTAIILLVYTSGLNAQMIAEKIPLGKCELVLCKVLSNISTHCRWRAPFEKDSSRWQCRVHFCQFSSVLRHKRRQASICHFFWTWQKCLISLTCVHLLCTYESQTRWNRTWFQLIRKNSTKMKEENQPKSANKWLYRSCVCECHRRSVWERGTALAHFVFGGWHSVEFKKNQNAHILSAESAFSDKHAYKTLELRRHACWLSAAHNCVRMCSGAICRMPNTVCSV